MEMTIDLWSQRLTESIQKQLEVLTRTEWLITEDYINERDTEQISNPRGISDRNSYNILSDLLIRRTIIFGCLMVRGLWFT